MNAQTPSARLVDDWQSHLKFAGREPRTLEELAFAKADYEHRRRLAEIKAIRPKLALLEEFLPAIKAAGINLARRDLSTWDSGKTLRIQPSMFESDNKLFATLIDLGFREIERKDAYRQEQRVTLKHGRALRVEIDVKKSDAAAEKGAAT